MSTLFMIRHGQASFGESDYDKLSELGITQSFFLGEHWVQRGLKLDAALSGLQRRQEHTMEIVGEVYKVAGMEFPEFEMDEGFNEYDAKAIMTRFFPKLLKENKRLQEILASESKGQLNSAEGRKSFQEVFEIVMNSWIKGEAEVDGVESWMSFKDRVVTAIGKIMDKYPDGKNVAVFTSGGAISAALQFALEVSDNKALDLGWVLKNASITEFKYKSDKFTLAGFNMTPHFYEDSLVTYR